MELIEKKKKPYRHHTPFKSSRISGGSLKIGPFTLGRNKKAPGAQWNQIRISSDSRVWLRLQHHQVECVCPSRKSVKMWAKVLRVPIEGATVCARVTSEVLRVYGRHKWNESRSARWGSGASIDALLFSARRHRREQQLGRYKAPQLCSGRGTRLDEQLRCSQYIYDPYTKWDEISLDSIKRVNASAAQSLSTPTHS